MVDSMMVTTNPVQDPASNFAPHNPPLGHEYPVTAANAAVKRAESVSRKLARAQHNLEEAIKSLYYAGFETEALEHELARVIEARNIARVKRSLARDAAHDAAIKAIEDLED